MKKLMNILIVFLFPGIQSIAVGDSYYGLDHVPSAPAAGQSGSTAIHGTSNAIIAWADGYLDVQYGAEVDAQWRTPEKALGMAEGTAFEIVSLGRGGQITLTFPQGIGDGSGFDFAVFENGISDGFLELAYVEVSSDGTNFVRFPNYSYTPGSVGSFGSLDTRLIYGLAGKYRQGYGTPFDLNELQMAYNAQLAGQTDFSSAFATMLTNNFPLLDLSHITHLRLVDVVGDGSALDSRGSIIYDPYPTVGSAGFDLDAVGVQNQLIIVQVPYAEWANTHSVSTNGLGDTDTDGVVDFQEYMMGGDPNLGASAPVPVLGTSSNATNSVVLEYSLSRYAFGTNWVETSGDLVGWTNAVPLTTEQWSDPDFIHLKIFLSANDLTRFYRLVFDGP